MSNLDQALRDAKQAAADVLSTRHDAEETDRRRNMDKWEKSIEQNIPRAEAWVRENLPHLITKAILENRTSIEVGCIKSGWNDPIWNSRATWGEALLRVLKDSKEVKCSVVITGTDYDSEGLIPMSDICRYFITWEGSSNG